MYVCLLIPDHHPLTPPLPQDINPNLKYIHKNNNYKTRKGIEPLFKDLQSNTLPIMLPRQKLKFQFLQYKSTITIKINVNL